MPKAECEARAFAWRILKPRVPVTREIGSDELTRVMEKTLEEVTAACVALETIDERHIVTVYSDSSYLFRDRPSALPALIGAREWLPL